MKRIDIVNIHAICYPNVYVIPYLLKIIVISYNSTDYYLIRMVSSTTCHIQLYFIICLLLWCLLFSINRFFYSLSHTKTRPKLKLTQNMVLFLSFCVKRLGLAYWHVVVLYCIKCMLIFPKKIYIFLVYY